MLTSYASSRIIEKFLVLLDRRRRGLIPGSPGHQHGFESWFRRPQGKAIREIVQLMAAKQVYGRVSWKFLLVKCLTAPFGSIAGSWI